MTFASAGYGVCCLLYAGLAVDLTRPGRPAAARHWVAMAAAVTVVWAGLLALVVAHVATPDWLIQGVEIVRYAVWYAAARALIAARGAARLALIGITGQLAYDLFMYAQGWWLGLIDPTTWALRGAAVALLMPTIFLSARRSAQGRPDLFVSRHVVFYAGLFCALGGYVLLAAIGGYFVRFHAGSWGKPLQWLIYVGATGAAASIVLTDSLQRRLRVLIATHFYRTKYDYRIEWLRFIRTLSSNHEGGMRRTAIQAVAQIFGCPCGAIFMRVGDSDRFVATATWAQIGQADVDAGHLPALSGVSGFFEQRQWVIDLCDYWQSPRSYGVLRLPDWLHQHGGWRIMTPLFDLDRLVGIMVLGEPGSPFEMTFEDRDLLKTVGRHIAVQIGQQDANQKLTESRQFDAYNRFGAFVMHDLKNSVAQLQLLVSNAARHRKNPEFIDDAISTISNAVGRMTRLIEQLQGREVHGHPRELALLPLVRAAVGRSQNRQPAPVLLGADSGALVRADAEKLGSVLDHVIRNAQDATGENGVVAVRVNSHGGHAILEFEDNGAGMDPEFVRDRLFRPFDSTKGTKGMGIGAYQTRDYVRLLGGEVEVQSSPGRGTIFCIRLPLCRTIDPAS